MVNSIREYASSKGLISNNDTISKLQATLVKMMTHVSSVSSDFEKALVKSGFTLREREELISKPKGKLIETINQKRHSIPKVIRWLALMSQIPYMTRESKPATDYCFQAIQKYLPFQLICFPNLESHLRGKILNRPQSMTRISKS